MAVEGWKKAVLIPNEEVIEDLSDWENIVFWGHEGGTEKVLEEQKDPPDAVELKPIGTQGSVADSNPREI